MPIFRRPTFTITPLTNQLFSPLIPHIFLALPCSRLLDPCIQPPFANPAQQQVVLEDIGSNLQHCIAAALHLLGRGRIVVSGGGVSGWWWNCIHCCLLSFCLPVDRLPMGTTGHAKGYCFDARFCHRSAVCTLPRLHHTGFTAFGLHTELNIPAAIRIRHAHCRAGYAFTQRYHRAAPAHAPLHTTTLPFLYYHLPKTAACAQTNTAGYTFLATSYFC